MIKLLCKIIFLSAFLSQAIAKEKLELPKKSILDLINDEIKTLMILKNKSAKLNYRHLELLAEKLKVVHSEENKIFIKNPTKYKSKEAFFKKTKKLYQEAHSLGLRYIKKHKRSQFRGPMYYTLALNSRDFGHDGREYKYLTKALNLSPRTSSFRYAVNVSLAEYFYNSKKYSKAVSKYKSIIKNQEDEWLPKNLLNYGWCLFKTQKFTTAMSTVEDAFILSNSDNYINISEQAIQALVAFYVFGKDIDRGVAFIKKHSKDVPEHLFKLAKKSGQKGFYDNASKIMAFLNDNHSDNKLVNEYHLFLLSMYKQYKKNNLFVSKAQFLTKLSLDKFQKEEVTNTVSDSINQNQVILKKNYDGVTKDFDQNTLSQTIQLFAVLEKINPEKRHEYLFLIAETYYSIGQYSNALANYKTIFDEYKGKPSLEDLHKSLEGIYSSIKFMTIPKKQEMVEIEYAYTQHLKHWPQSKSSNLVYPKYITLKMEQKQYDRGYELITQYRKNYPKEKKIHIKQFKYLLKTLIEAKEVATLNKYVNIARSGSFNLKTNFVSKMETVLASLLFKQLDQKRAIGEFAQAAKGYQNIYFEDNYPLSVRSEAAFQAAIILHENQEYNENLKWFKKSFEILTSVEKNKKRSTIEKIAVKTGYLQNFLLAEKYNEFVLDNFCSQKNKNLAIYRQLIDINLANDYKDKALYNYKKYQSCISTTPPSITVGLADHLFLFKHYNKYLSFINENEMTISKNNLQTTIVNLEYIYWEEYFANNNTEDTLKTLKKYSIGKYNHILKYNKLLKKYSYQNIKFLEKNIKISDELTIEAFMPLLQKRLTQIAALTAKKDELLQSQDQYTIYLTYLEFIDFSKRLTAEITDYLKLRSPDKDINSQFQQQMNELIANFNVNTQNTEKTLKEILAQNEIIIPEAKDKKLALYTFDFK